MLTNIDQFFMSHFILEIDYVVSPDTLNFFAGWKLASQVFVAMAESVNGYPYWPRACIRTVIFNRGSAEPKGSTSVC